MKHNEWQDTLNKLQAQQDQTKAEISLIRTEIILQNEIIQGAIHKRTKLLVEEDKLIDKNKELIHAQSQVKHLMELLKDED